MKFHPHPLILRAALGGLLLGSLPALAAELTVSAASSLGNAFKDIAVAFEADHPGTRVLLNIGASDALLAQISKGAPVDLLASADQETMDRAETQKVLVSGTRRNFAGNRLVLIVPSTGSVVIKALPDLQRADVQRMALGKPEGVPAGRYAKSALVAAQLWPAVATKAVYASNVRQALDYVARAEVDAGFVYATDAAIQQDKVRIAAVVPTPTPISYPVAVVAGSSNVETARRFIDYLLSPAGQAILARYGFQKP
ncbi:molybdate ABC transporter substrate-binding protein [Roseateles sp. DB2]|uniref:molybdate ABC transporter substrate-binding protein n=1 Tax=Roseateles sp. DB2 TaxID=3453717 RepID=UPI003EEDF363